MENVAKNKIDVVSALLSLYANQGEMLGGMIYAYKPGAWEDEAKNEGSQPTKVRQ